MTKLSFPYGKNTLEYDFSEERLQGVLLSRLEEYIPEKGEQELVLEALATPIGTPSLAELSRGKKKVVLIASDHTRPVPSRLIVPPMLSEIRRGNPEAEITILVATGCHRGTTREELVAKFGEELVAKERIVVHDCDDEASLAPLGILPSGGLCRIHSLALKADLLVSEGFIEPHFFAGFSGGRKSVLPGICARETVLANHCSEFIASPHAKTGILEGNPIHEDMLWAAKKAGLAFVVNVVLNGEKKVVCAVAGDAERAHAAGCEFLSERCVAHPVPADIVISTNGGYPLDQNVYQAVKGMTAAESTVKKDGVIIMLAESGDGVGGDHFFHQLADEPSIEKTMAGFLARSRGETVPDQWQTQILLRVMMHARVIFISSLEDDLIRQMHMTPAHSIGEALALAKEMLGREDPTVTAIPDGVAVVVRK